MNRVPFLQHWQRVYGGKPLLGHVLRTRLPERWLRIHSLPGSKRYADTPEETAEILRRQNTLLRDLIGAGGRCVLVYTDDGDVALPASVATLASESLVTVSSHESDLADDFPQLMAPFTYTEGVLDELLVAIAEEVVHLAVVVGVDAPCIVAPYDGGCDLIVEHRARRDELRRRYAGWLSPHPSGT